MRLKYETEGSKLPQVEEETLIEHLEPFLKGMVYMQLGDFYLTNAIKKDPNNEKVNEARVYQAVSKLCLLATKGTVNTAVLNKTLGDLKEPYRTQAIERYIIDAWFGLYLFTESVYKLYSGHSYDWDMTKEDAEFSELKPVEKVKFLYLKGIKVIR